MIRRREATSAEVVEAHIALLQRVNPRLNAIVADRYDQAREQAAAADQRVANAGLRGADSADLPLLLGVPFTVKESIALAGMPHTAGLESRREIRATRNATAVKRLVDAGAIPLGVTNVSELTLWIESDNPVYGRTNNPYDQTRTAGGSSGGEGAAVGAGGAPFGVAADVGGSIRIPALFCGVFGHKPSAGLIPSTGMWPTSAGEAERMLTIGPIARRAEDLLPLLKIMAGPDGQDPIVTDMELGDTAAVSLDGLQVTVVEDSSAKPMARELRDARERAVGALAAAGARVRSVSLPSWKSTLLPFLTELQNHEDESLRVHSMLQTGAGPDRPAHAPADSAGDEKLVLAQSPAGLTELLRGHHTLPTRLTLLAEAVPLRPQMRSRLLERARALADELTETIGDGVLLHPAHLSTAPKHHRTYGRPWLTTPAAIFNLAGVPVTEVPLGLGPRGLPLGVQVAARHGADHLTIAVALELEAVFGGWVPPPGL